MGLVNSPKKVIYRILLPLTVIVFLLIVPSFVNRSLILNSAVFDWGTRIILAVWFCNYYWRMPKLFPQGTEIGLGRRLIKNNFLGILYFILSSLFFSIFTSLFTYFAIIISFPNLNGFASPISILNGALFIINSLIQYRDYFDLANQ
jgi:hypothetical protein